MNRHKRGIVRERIAMARARGAPERAKWARRSGVPMPGNVAAQRAAGLKRVRRQERNLVNVARGGYRR